VNQDITSKFTRTFLLKRKTAGDLARSRRRLRGGMNRGADFVKCLFPSIGAAIIHSPVIFSRSIDNDNPIDDTFKKMAENALGEHPPSQSPLALKNLQSTFLRKRISRDKGSIS
jgi:hypothetical protein